MLQKLIEISYYHENTGSFIQLKEKHLPSLHLLKYLSLYFKIETYKFADFSGINSVFNVPVHINHSSIGKWTIPFAFHHKIKQQNPDFILIHGINNFFQIIHLKLILPKKVKLMVQHHGERPFGLFKGALLKLSSRMVDAYLFSSLQTAVKLGIDKTKVHELMEGSTEMKGIDKNKAREILNIGPEETVYLWVGRLVDVKNPLFFLEAFHEFSLKQKRSKLYMIYSDDTLLSKCKTICAGNPNIVFVGKVNHSELQNWYSMADFFVAASITEGSGYALCEAMACNTIPIVSDIPSFRFMTNDGKCALLYASQNKNKLLNVLNESLQLDKISIRKKIKTQFDSKLSFDSISKELNAIISGL